MNVFVQRLTFSDEGRRVEGGMSNLPFAWQYQYGRFPLSDEINVTKSDI